MRLGLMRRSEQSNTSARGDYAAFVAAWWKASFPIGVRWHTVEVKVPYGLLCTSSTLSSNSGHTEETRTL